MPTKKSSKNEGVLKKLGAAAKTAHNKHKGDDTRISGGMEPPAGIENGVAQLVECKFDVYKDGDNKGKVFFYAAGTIVEPKKFEGAPVEGLRTSIMEPICDTPTRSRKTVEEHIDWVLNELRKLGVDTSDTEFDDLEDVVEALKEEGPYFRFRTWKGKKATEGQYKDREPRTQHQWSGLVEDFVPDESDEVEDDTEVEEEAEEDDAPKPKPKPAAGGKGGKKPPKSKPAPEPEEDEEPDLEALGEAADGDDEEAQETLNKLALEAGIAQKVIDKAKSWTSIAEKIAEATGDDEEEAEAEEEAEEAEEEETAEAEADEDEWEPAKEDIYGYKPPKSKKVVECEVIAVLKKARTVSLKQIDNDKVHKGVSWDDLVEAPES